MHNESIGMFWDVNDNLWIKNVSLNDFKQKLKSSFNMRSVTQSDDQTLHYICHKCKPSSFDDKGRYLE